MEESSLFSNQRGRLPRKRATALADLILRGEKKKLPVNIIFSDDAAVEELNHLFRGRKKPTDVLSFAGDPELGILGEIYISIDTARRQAREYGVTLEEEILRLVCHGTLHLCGYDHHEEHDRKRMKAREEKYLGRLKKNG